MLKSNNWEHGIYSVMLIKEEGSETVWFSPELEKQLGVLDVILYGIEYFNPAGVTPVHIRRYLAYMKNELNNCAKTRNHKLNAIAGYYHFLELAVA